MKVVQVVTGSAVLLFVLTWLAVRGMTGAVQPSEQWLRALDDFAAAESALHRDVLAARAGILRNYDPLVAEINSMQAATGRLSAQLPPEIGNAGPLQALRRMVDHKEAWTERFKSRNALLQNSLAQFNLSSHRLSGPGHAPALVQEVSGLATVMLHLTLDTSPPSAEAVDVKLGRLRGFRPAADDAALVQALLSHAELLKDVLPETDRIVRSIVMTNSDPQREALRALIRLHDAEAEEAVGVFRIILYAASLVLAGFLVAFGVQLRSHARSLRQRANVEHVIADFSTRVINSYRTDIAWDVEAVLGALAKCLSAERAYFVAPGDPPQIFRWSRHGADFPRGWPLRAMELTTVVKPRTDGILYASVGKRECAGRISAVLAAAGTKSWLCIAGPQGGAPLLGFDCTRASFTGWHHHCGLFRMAYDAIASALDRDNLEREKERLQVGLQRARRMETIGSLASGIAHNFNNIIGAILGRTEMAFGYAEAGSRLADNLAEIRRAGERARDIVDQILAFGRRDDVSRETLSMRDVVLEAQALLAVSLPPEVRLCVEAEADDVTVYGEPAQLQQVLLNVCTNSAQAMDEAGKIRVSIETRELKRTLRLAWEELSPGRYIVVSVADNGRGMTQATRDRIFDPFFTTRQDGNGLGLATVREIVRQHEGAIGVQSEPGVGTRFEIWLPSAGSGIGDAKPRPPSVAERGAGETILVVGSVGEDLLWQEEMLAALGYEPIGFAHPEDAIAACRQAAGRFDLILISNPAGTAAVLDLARRLSRVAPWLPIILATASAKEFSAPRLAGAGVRELIHLPLESAELACLLRRQLAHDRPGAGSESRG